MQKTIKLSSVLIDLPIELQNLRGAGHCRVSTEQEEQFSSIELQKQYYAQLIYENPIWKNVGISQHNLDCSKYFAGTILQVISPFGRIRLHRLRQFWFLHH